MMGNATGIALGKLAVRFGCELRGDPLVVVDHIAPLEGAGPGALSFLANAKLAAALAGTRASAVVLDAKSSDRCPVATLIAPNPHATFAQMANLIYPQVALRPGIHPTAIVDPSAKIDLATEVAAYVLIAANVTIGARCLIGPGSIIGPSVQIGSDCRLLSRVIIEKDVVIGERVLIHPGAILGSDGFGLAHDKSGWIKVPQIGSVRIGNDVEIGANTTIDRGAIDNTMICDGVKLDNQIQIGHNVFIGAHTAIAACTGVAGSTRIGARCVIGGHVGFAGHIEICDDVMIAGKSAVPHSIRQPGAYSGVVGLEPVRLWARMVGRLKVGVRREQRQRANEPRQEGMRKDQNDE
jgi:UDP-3-O-[3-hydroxymyristoyl] glucosamine N-acyltransferase